MNTREDAGEGQHSYSQSVNSCLTYTCTPGHVKEDVWRGGREGWRLNDLQSPPCCLWKNNKKHRRVDVGKLWQTMHKASLGGGGGCIADMPWGRSRSHVIEFLLISVLIWKVGVMSSKCLNFLSSKKRLTLIIQVQDRGLSHSLQ